MADFFSLDIGQSVQSEAKIWYRNLQVLGAGGNAITFLAVATSGEFRGVPFAIKVFRKLSKPEREESFMQEMQFLQNCDHPAIMRIFDKGIFYKQHPFFVAEYLPDTLHRVIRAGQTSIVLKISYSLQLLSALACLERRTPAVVHRDIKPQNIFVKGRSCVLGDFGLIKLVDDDNFDGDGLKQSIGVGMPFRYRSPDQVSYLKGESALTPRSDVFQLGLVLAELFTGRNPERPSQSFSASVELDPIGVVPGSLSRSVISILQRMLDMDPATRLSASEGLTLWEGVQKVAVERAHALEGRAIW